MTAMDGGRLEVGRALREQIDWDAVCERTSQSPYARAFFCLAHELHMFATPS